MDEYEDWSFYENGLFNTNTQPDLGSEVLGWSLGHKDLTESAPANEGGLIEFEFGI